jgi:hypothetical protein
MGLQAFWRQRTQAGRLFMAETSKSDRRRHKRRTVVWKGTLEAGAHQFVCWVRNISSSGMMVQVDLPLAPHSRVSVDLDRYGRFDGYIAWSSGVLHGLAFADGPDVICKRFGADAEALGLFTTEPLLTPA